jgi:formylmethanofuran dehydrogenase subunit A
MKDYMSISKICAFCVRSQLRDCTGSLGVGAEADIAVFNLEDVDVQLEDPLGQLRHVTTRLRCVLII